MYCSVRNTFYCKTNTYVVYMFNLSLILLSILFIHHQIPILAVVGLHSRNKIRILGSCAYHFCSVLSFKLIQLCMFRNCYEECSKTIENCLFVFRFERHIFRSLRDFWFKIGFQGHKEFVTEFIFVTQNGTVTHG